MNFAMPLGSAEIEKSAEVEVGGNIQELLPGTTTALREGEAGDAETSVDNLTALLRRISEGAAARTPTRNARRREIFAGHR